MERREEDGVAQFEARYVCDSICERVMLSVPLLVPIWSLFGLFFQFLFAEDDRPTESKHAHSTHYMQTETDRTGRR